VEDEMKKRDYVKGMSFVDAICFAYDNFATKQKVAIRKSTGTDKDYEFEQKYCILGWNNRIQEEETCLVGNEFIVSWDAR
jgi:hypothetical protein